MLFNSFQYAIFLPIVFILYWVIPHKFRWIILLISSYYFYMSWNATYVCLILGTTLISYIAALLIGNTNSKIKKNIVLIVSLVVCFGVLFIFKYYNFFIQSLCDFLSDYVYEYEPILLDILLPVGISFYTFQTVSYVIDVYNEKIVPEKHFGYYATFVSFFPQLVAGPIERTSNLLPQIREEHRFDYDKAIYGIFLILLGLYKKVLIADNLIPFVSRVFNTPDDYEGFSFIVATLFFTIQIYCDFSGYSDIAIGTSKLFNIDLMTNFRQPYFSKSLKEFWSRWHISLSTWFRDYVYIPLGGNRVGIIRNIFNLLITFTLSGLWHGANWTYLIWGLLHGIGLVIEKIIRPKSSNKNLILDGIFTVITFIFCSFVWTFFASKSLEDAIYIISNSFTWISDPVYYFTSGIEAFEFEEGQLTFILILIASIYLVDLLSIRFDIKKFILSLNPVIRAIIFFIICLILLFYGYTKPSTFVYFQF